MRAAPQRLRARDSRHVRPPEKRVDPFLTSRQWRALVTELIGERGARCEDPDHDSARPREAGRIYGDHIIERRDGGALLDKANIMLRCAACHGRKTAAARASRLRR